MKKIYYNILLVLVCGLFASCMNGNDGLFGDDWKVPATPDANLYGNPSIKETNLLTIAQLKAKYATEISTEGKYAQVTEPMQIKAIVTANDIQGNMYNEIAVQDETGAIFIGIAQGGVFGYLAVGQEILVELNGLYIGNYRKSATIGTPYTKDGDTSVSRMPRALWQDHFTYTGQTKTITPEVFSTSWDINTDAGKLCTIKNVSIKKGGYYNTTTKQYVGGMPVKFRPKDGEHADQYKAFTVAVPLMRVEEMYLIEYVTQNSQDQVSARNIDVNYVDDARAAIAAYSYVPEVLIRPTTEDSRILTGDYVIPYSDREYVTASALSMLTAEQLRLARNEIYARKGRLFKDQQLQQYFNSKPWYHGTIAPDSFKESMLSDVEKANAYFILNYERLKGYIR